MIDGINYQRIENPKRGRKFKTDYIHEAVAAYLECFRQYKPAVVISASNYVCALPALSAARILGVPFVYEVRGFCG